MARENDSSASAKDEKWFLKNLDRLSETFGTMYKTEEEPNLETNMSIFEKNQNKVIGEIMEENVVAEIQEKPIKVYVKRDENGNVKEVNSELFIDNFEGWEYLDEGFGDKYAHAQSHYFDKPLFDDVEI